MSTSTAAGLLAARDFDRLIALSETGSVKERRVAVRDLGALRRQHVVDALERSLLDDEVRVRIDAARALSPVGGDRAVVVLVGGSASPDDLGAAIVRALGVLGDPRGTTGSDEWTASRRRSHASMAALALGRIGTPEAVEPLAVALADDHRQVRSQAREALISIGQPHGLDALRENRRRSTIMRRLDVRAAALPATRVTDREQGRVPLTVDRLTTRLLAAALMLYVAVVFLLDVVVIEAPVLPFTVAALVTAIVSGKLTAFVDADEHLDVTRRRAETG